MEEGRSTGSQVVERGDRRALSAVPPKKQRQLLGSFLVPFETRERLCERIRTGDELEIDTTAATLTNHTTGETFLLNPLGDVAEILKAGGVFEYARRAGFIRR